FGYWRLRRLAAPMLLGSIALLLLVWAPKIGVTHNGAARWVGWGFFQLQPSEITKLALVVYLSAILFRTVYDVRNFGDGLAAAMVIVLLIVALVEREPDLGTAAIIFLASLTLFFLAGAGLPH